ncbi:MAG: hypothetical protein IJW95_04690 [Clostridia bacterium]|jgi:hypothetical protein|nr:hypothetical protein [Clostridia bacterium]MBQ7940383.1 hypothetical protein [Clostridia bacterium]
MDSITTIVIAMLSVYGFYCILMEIRDGLLRLCRKKKTNVLPEIDKEE